MAAGGHESFSSSGRWSESENLGESENALQDGAYDSDRGKAYRRDSKRLYHYSCGKWHTPGGLYRQGSVRKIKGDKSYDG